MRLVSSVVITVQCVPLSKHASKIWVQFEDGYGRQATRRTLSLVGSVSWYDRRGFCGLFQAEVYGEGGVTHVANRNKDKTQL